jgi:hypothetical protein
MSMEEFGLDDIEIEVLPDISVTGNDARKLPGKNEL